MTSSGETLRGKFSVSLIASVLVHVAVIGLLLVSWNIEEDKPQAEETVSVEIVPPPEEEPPPEPEPEEQQPEEPAAEEEAPPPPPPEQTEEEQSTQTETASGSPSSIEPFRPVFEFGQEQSGPEVATAGNATTGETEEDDAGLAEQALEETDQVAPEAGNPAPPAPELTTENSDLGIAAIIDTNTDATKETEQEETQPEERPEDTEQLEQARTIFSETEGEAAAAVTAMANLPRGIRGGELCTTELREQLRHASPAYRPRLLPSYRFPDGNSLRVQKGAFRTEDGWFAVRFECQINNEGTRITGFSFKVDGAIPRGEWAARGLPSN